MSEFDVTPQIFLSFQEYLDNEQEIREQIRQNVRDVEQVGRQMVMVYQRIHQPAGLKNLPEVCKQGEGLFENAKEALCKLSDSLPKNEYYRFHDHWKFVMQRLCFLAALHTYISSNKLIKPEETADLFGVTCNRDDGFHLELDDYLMGLLQLASELSRWAVNAVTAGNYQRPMEISKFMSELDAGFRLLNLKNDGLRKRFDALKYDLKKVEEVVYDVTIRGLKPGQDQSETTDK